MNSLNPLLVDSYDYRLPKELIASSPAIPKDSAKLLVYDRKTDTIAHSIFRDIEQFIPQNTKVILNDTKVIKARLFGKKDTGGKIELLINSPLPNREFLVYIRGKIRENMNLYFDNELEAKIKTLNIDGTRVVSFFHKKNILNFEELNEILEQIGHIPLPPYIKREDSKKDEVDYQTLFAKNIGAVAAPTASLHFSDKLYKNIKDRFDAHFITLHVGAGTFKPVEATNINEHIMHKEFYNIPNNTKKLLDSQQNILAVGTTVTRTIEYYERTKVQKGESNLFLHPHNRPKRVNHLLTNFHLPKSTLLMLIASFIGLEKTLYLYNEAIKKEYKFYSYGDAMLIL